MVKELKDQIEKLKEELAKAGGGGDPEQVKLLSQTVASLEYAKKQTWEEKQNISRKFEENRWSSLAKNGMLQLKVNLMKKQKTTLEANLKKVTKERDTLQKEVEFLYQEIAQLKQENAQKQADMDALCADVATMLQAEGGKLQSMEETVATLEEENARLRSGQGVEHRSTPVTNSGRTSVQGCDDLIKLNLLKALLAN